MSIDYIEYGIKLDLPETCTYYTGKITTRGVMVVKGKDHGVKKICLNFPPANNKEYMESQGYIPPWAVFVDRRTFARGGEIIPQSEKKNLQVGNSFHRWTKKTSRRVSEAYHKLAMIPAGFRSRSRKTGKTSTVKLTSITLTFPCKEIIDRKRGNKLLHTLLTILKTRYGLRLYVWVNEDQARGQLHYHIAADCPFISHKNIEKHWNSILNKAGLLEEFFRKHGHKNPRSTETKAIVEGKAVNDYLYSYMAKASQHTQECNGRLWGQSRLLAKAKLPEIVMDKEQYKKLQQAYIDDKVRIERTDTKPPGSEREVMLNKHWILINGNKHAEILTEKNNLNLLAWIGKMRKGKLPFNHRRGRHFIRTRPPLVSGSAYSDWELKRYSQGNRR